jgi:hypothetical protein
MAFIARDPKRASTKCGAPSLLVVSQTQDVGDDAVSVGIFNNEIRHRTVRGVQRNSQRSGRHSWSIGNFCERRGFFIYRPAFLFSDQVTFSALLARDPQPCSALPTSAACAVAAFMTRTITANNA